MNIKDLNIKQKVLVGSALAVLSAYVPPVIGQAHAGTATMPVSIEIVAAVNLANTNALDFGRLALTGAVAGNNHTLSPGGVTTTAAGATVVQVGTPGNFDITSGISAGDVQVSYPASVTYDGGNIVLDRLTLGGVGFTAPVTVAAGGTATGVFAGGVNTAVDVGGRLNFVATPSLGSYSGSSATININDIP